MRALQEMQNDVFHWMMKAGVRSASSAAENDALLKREVGRRCGEQP
jgi:hypothetical protein